MGFIGLDTGAAMEYGKVLDFCSSSIDFHFGFLYVFALCKARGSRVLMREPFPATLKMRVAVFGSVCESLRKLLVVHLRVSLLRAPQLRAPQSGVPTCAARFRAEEPRTPRPAAT